MHPVPMTLTIPRLTAETRASRSQSDSLEPDRGHDRMSSWGERLSSIWRPGSRGEYRVGPKILGKEALQIRDFWKVVDDDIGIVRI